MFECDKGLIRYLVSTLAGLPIWAVPREGHGVIVKIWQGRGGHNLSWLSDWGVWRGTPLESVGDNHSPDPMYVRQWDHAHLVLLGLVGGR